jgi:hypothetical protein
MVTVPADQAIPLPDGWSYEQGAAFPVNYATSTRRAGDDGAASAGGVLIHAAAGGVWISAIQIARSRNAEIFGTASASKHDAIREQGVQHAIDYRTQDFEKEIRQITGGEGIDLVMDATGPTNFRKDYRLLREGGRLIMYGLSEASTETGRDMKKLFSSLARMPFATVPWWKSLQLMSENKGVFGLNMLAWQDREGLDQGVDHKELERHDLHRSGHRRGVLFRRRGRCPPLHRRAPKHRQGRARPEARLIGPVPVTIGDTSRVKSRPPAFLLATFSRGARRLGSAGVPTRSGPAQPQRRPSLHQRPHLNDQRKIDPITAMDRTGGWC